jgi:hypothetical protein
MVREFGEAAKYETIDIAQTSNLHIRETIPLSAQIGQKILSAAVAW